MAEPMERIKNRAMRRANELTTARIIIDRHPCVGTGPFTRYKIAIGQVQIPSVLTGIIHWEDIWVGEPDECGSFLVKKGRRASMLSV
jgi:hypothetical protein